VIVESDGLTFAIASDAVTILKGTEIDMVTEGVNRVVKFNNPNVTAECGCGESFSIG
jgi:Fe-S cluster assembly protein SufA/iron-sulfur cluster assembly protein